MTHTVDQDGRTGPGPADSPGTRAQTLHRGVRVLEILCAAQRPMAIAAIAQRLEVHRSIVYRILRTLEDHRLVARTAEGAYELGLGLPILARGVSHNLQSAAMPVLSDLANDVQMTAFIVVAKDEEAITLLTVEPRLSAAHVAYAPGMRHPLDHGAPGLALLAAHPPRSGERTEVAEVRQRGYAHSYNEVLSGMSSVSVPIVSTRALAAVAVVYVQTPADQPAPIHPLGERVMAAASEITADLA